MLYIELFMSCFQFFYELLNSHSKYASIFISLFWQFLVCNVYFLSTRSISAWRMTFNMSVNHMDPYLNGARLIIPIPVGFAYNYSQIREENYVKITSNVASTLFVCNISVSFSLYMIRNAIY